MSQRWHASGTGSDRLRGMLAWLPAVALMALIFLLSSQSGIAVSDDAAVERPIRIVAHLCAYAALAGLLLVALGSGSRSSLRAVPVAYVLAVLYGASDELHQSFIPGRNGRVDDLVVDATGALVGVLVAWLVLRRRPRAAAATETRGASDPNLT